MLLSAPAVLDRSARVEPLLRATATATAEIDARLSMAAERHALVAGLSGRVIEVGAGNGRTFARYPAEVTEVVAGEPEPRLRAEAGKAARQAPIPVRVIDAGPAESRRRTTCFWAEIQGDTRPACVADQIFTLM